MSPPRIDREDCVGLLRPALDAHTLGLASVAQLLGDCGVRSAMAEAAVCVLTEDTDRPANMDSLARWIRTNGISILGCSYRLDPRDGALWMGRLVNALKNRRMLREQGGPLRAMFFAGLPETCRLVRSGIPEVSSTFDGDETPVETLTRLGVETSLVPGRLSAGIRYDEDRLAFGRELIRKADYRAIEAVDRSGYREFGTRQDTLVARLRHGRRNAMPPLMRAHVGPYGPDRKEAVRLFLDWCRQLGRTRLLDVLSIGTSQLTQSNFGEDWGSRPNGGGVPLNSKDEFAAAWEASRPMLVRCYAGTKNIPGLARMYEETINIAWHALSLWWFCRIDGRGPYSVRENLQHHIEAIDYIASTGKPFEANVPHHFAFRGADDVTYVVSAVIAARVAKARGIRHFVLQNMLNTPKYTWGMQDLAKARAMLQLVRELEDERFQVTLQPRGGLDYFSHDPEKAKAQLAAVTALMDDIEPADAASPQVIHVVSYSEGYALASPEVIDDSIRITRHALAKYRDLKARGEADDMAANAEVDARVGELLDGAGTVLRGIEASVPEPYGPEGLYRIMAQGFLPVPYLWERRDEFRHACSWRTAMVRGGMKVVDDTGAPISPTDRIEATCAIARTERADAANGKEEERSWLA